MNHPDEGTVEWALGIRKALFADEVHPALVDQCYADVQRILGEDWETIDLPPEYPKTVGTLEAVKMDMMDELKRWNDVP